MSEIVDEIRQWSENIKLPYRLRQLLKISLEQMEELSSEKKHAELGWEQSGKWLIENGQIRDELGQTKEQLAIADNHVQNLSIELAEKDKVLEWYANALKDNVRGDRGENARTILSQYKKGEGADDQPGENE